jgi:phosphate transport system substrate-binding protein
MYFSPINHSTAGILLGIVLCTSPAMAEYDVFPTLDPNIPHYTPQDHPSGKVKIIGSTTMKGFLKEWKEKLEILHPDLKIELETEGSNTGVEPLFSENTTIAAMSRPMKAAEIQKFTKQVGYPPTAVPVAVDALAVFVHKDNPLDHMTFQQLAAVFTSEKGQAASESIDQWGKFGLTGRWKDAPINVHGRDSKSGTAQFFKEWVLKGGKDKETITVEAGAASVVYEVMNDPYAIGYSGIGYRTESVKPLKIALREGEDFIEPTFESATDGSYPLRRLLYLYVNQPPQARHSPLLSELIRFAVSLEGQKIVVKSGFFPPPTKELMALSAEWSNPVTSAATGRTQ